jgi:hypothetical protein
MREGASRNLVRLRAKKLTQVEGQRRNPSRLSKKKPGQVERKGTQAG